MKTKTTIEEHATGATVTIEGPLAARLLGHAAETQSTPDELVEAWIAEEAAKEIRMTGDRITVSGRILEKLEEAAEAEGRELDDAFFSEALSIGLDSLPER